MNIVYNTTIILNIESCFFPEAVMIFINMVPEITVNLMLKSNLVD